jgi:sn-glycerol 3-phosphate transport system substrate-binding protein
MPLTGGAIDLLDAEGWFADKPHNRVVIDQLAVSDGSPAARGAVLGDFHGIQLEMARAMHDVLVSGAEPVARFGTATGRAQKLLDAYNTHCLGNGTGRRTPYTLEVS